MHDKKLAILALCACLELDPAAIPETLKDGWPGIVGGILSIFKALPKAIEGRLLSCFLSIVLILRKALAREALEEAFQDDSEDGDDIDDSKLLNLNEDDGTSSR